VTSGQKPQAIRGVMSCQPKGTAGTAQVTFRQGGGQISHFDLFCQGHDPVAVEAGLRSPTHLRVRVPANTEDIDVDMVLYQTYPGTATAACLDQIVTLGSLPTVVPCSGGGVSATVALD
jgi:hypothetical protein